jgi:HPt (histidine-containing phosphotransfer) domain-containing protein
MNPWNRPHILLAENNNGGPGGEAPGASHLPATILSDRILESFSTRPQRLAAFFDMVCNDLGTQLAAMKSALEAGDPAALRDAAHAAKGVAQGLRDQSLSRLAEEIEQQARQGDISGLEQKLSECMDMYLLLKR